MTTLTDDDKQFLTDNPNTDDLVEFVEAYAARAVIVAHEAKQAGEVMKWTHGCNALCTNIELWIDHCPHCGKPREAAHLKKPEPQTPVQAGWQPIETAPKDGVFLVSRSAGDQVLWVSEARRGKGVLGKMFYAACGTSIAQPTYWMPLPAAPKGGV